MRRRSLALPAAARAAGLRYVTDTTPGLCRRRIGGGFAYFTPGGRRIGDRHVLARIAALTIPPAWTDVWICPRTDGHVQAVGRDARGRKQYRYHASWRAHRDAKKYHRMLRFARCLPVIRRRVVADLRRLGLPREKVVALLVRLLEGTAIRVGNEEYARTNGSYGLTTLRGRHAQVSARRVRFSFRGKGGKTHTVDVDDPRVARLVKRCRDLPGQELFQYVAPDGRVRSIGSSDVNAYLRAASGEAFTAKDFRTWKGTVTAASALAAARTGHSTSAAKRSVVEAIRQVAAELGNTPAVCRASYVHPVVLDAFARGETIGTTRAAVKSGTTLTPAERAVATLLARAGSSANAQTATAAERRIAS